MQHIRRFSVPSQLGINWLYTGKQATAISKDAYAAHIAGVPDTVLSKNVRIYQPCKTAMQSGKAASRVWKLDFDIGKAWENSTMGWISSRESVQALNLYFGTREEAISFAERQGYHYWIDEPRAHYFRKKVYADNYTYVPGKLRMAHTK